MTAAESMATVAQAIDQLREEAFASYRELVAERNKLRTENAHLLVERNYLHDENDALKEELDTWRGRANGPAGPLP